jgi:hypothetical protein
VFLRPAKHKKVRLKIDHTVQFSKKVAENAVNRPDKEKSAAGGGQKSHDELSCPYLLTDCAHIFRVSMVIKCSVLVLTSRQLVQVFT